MANNLEREVIGILDAIIGVEEHLRSGTHGHDEGWSTATEGIRAAQHEELLALRRKLLSTLARVPEVGLQALSKLLEEDGVLSNAFLDAQLEAAKLGIGRASVRNVSPARW